MSNAAANGVSSKRTRPIPHDFERTIYDVTLLAKKRAISLLDKCLNNHHLNATEQRDLILDVSRAFDLAVASHEVNADSDHCNVDGNPLQEKQRISSRICTGSLKETVNRKKEDDHNRKKEDDHNEVCEVCEKGGDLLCCDTCSLVFHLCCIRPKISSIPKGKWSCAHCVSDGVGTGDSSNAKKALVMMGRLSRGLESEEEQDDNVTSKSNRIGDIVVIRSGKRFIVRKLAHSQIVELGRYDNLDDALGSIKPVYKKALTVVSSATSEVTVTTPIGAVEDDDLWCTHCMDDPAVAVCAFCGCRTCFGKHNSEYLLLCDYCDQESHTYCLTPQLTEIPEDAWYCGSCINLGLAKSETTEISPIEIVSNSEGGEEEGMGVTESTTAINTVYRVKGRPGRPKKVFPVPPPFEDFASITPRPLKVPGRGRGRPPGTGRIPGSEALGYSRKHKLSSLPQIASDSINPGSGQFFATSFHSTVVGGSGVAAVLSILENCAGKRPLYPAEKLVINQFREWSPLEDLQTVHAALVLQEAYMLQRIRCFDPSFSEPSSSARSIKHAAVSMSKKVNDCPSTHADGAARLDSPCTAAPDPIDETLGNGSLGMSVVNESETASFCEANSGPMTIDCEEGYQYDDVVELDSYACNQDDVTERHTYENVLIGDEGEDCVEPTSARDKAQDASSCLEEGDNLDEDHVGFLEDEDSASQGREEVESDDDEVEEKRDHGEFMDVSGIFSHR